MEDDREELIRQRAYDIWEEQGRPQGEDMRHWLQAWQELSDAGAGDQDIGAADASALTVAERDESTAAAIAAPSADNADAPLKSQRKKKG